MSGEWKREWKIKSVGGPFGWDAVVVRAFKKKRGKKDSFTTIDIADAEGWCSISLQPEQAEALLAILPDAIRFAREGK